MTPPSSMNGLRSGPLVRPDRTVTTRLELRRWRTTTSTATATTATVATHAAAMIMIWPLRAPALPAPEAGAEDAPSLPSGAAVPSDSKPLTRPALGVGVGVGVADAVGVGVAVALAVV